MQIKCLAAQNANIKAIVLVPCGLAFHFFSPSRSGGRFGRLRGIGKSAAGVKDNIAWRALGTRGVTRSATYESAQLKKIIPSSHKLRNSMPSYPSPDWATKTVE